MSDPTAILLIDGNPRMRGLLAQHLRGRRFETAEAADGLEAVRALRELRPSLIVVDHAVPMGGVKTARLLRLHPERQTLPFLILGGEPPGTEGDEGLYHLSRPCSAEQLRQAVDACLRMQLQAMSVDDVRREIAELAQLPALSAAHRKILGLLGQEEASIDVPEVVRTIESDQGLTMAVLRVCNSAYYGFRGNSIDLAITFLGIDKVRAIVQAAIVFDVFSQAATPAPVGGVEDDFTLKDLWTHSVACGVVMGEGGQRVKGRDHFIAGMLHDVGKVVICLRLPLHFAEIRRVVVQEGRSMVEAERELLGITHADIGYELARKWELPPTIATCIAFHHYPGRALQHRRLSALVHTADIAVRMMQIGSGGDAVVPRLDESARPLARQVMTVLDRKEAVLEQVETMVSEYALDGARRPPEAKQATA